MTTDSIVILGVPVDILEMEEALSRLFSMAAAYDADGRPRMAVAVTAETIMRMRASANRPAAGKTSAAKSPAYLINTLRNADLMIPVGLPVAWAARILGIKLKKRIPTEAFFTNFLEAAAANGKTVVLIRNSAPSDRHAHTDLRYEWFFLTDTGSQGLDDGPRKGAAGEGPLEAIHDKINSTGADFLVIDIHDPDLAAWFEESKNRIHVPVILVVTGNTNLIETLAKKTINGARPAAMRPVSAHKPFSKGFFKRLYRRYFELGLMVLPLVIYQKYNQAMFNIRHQPSMIPSIKSASPKPARGMSVRVISMPDPLDASVTGDIRERILKMSQAAQKIVLDFSRVNFMDSSGLGLLMVLCRSSAAENREILLAGVKPNILRFFRLTKTFDFFEARIHSDLSEVLENIKTRVSTPSFYYLALIRNHAVVFNFYGKLDAAEIMDLNTEALMNPVTGRDVILNFAGLEFIDSAGMRLVVKIHRHASKHNGVLIVCGMRPAVKHLFSIVGTKALILVEADINAAELALRRRHIQRFEQSDETRANHSNYI